MLASKTRINVPLLVTTLAYIEEHPEAWDQAYWRHVPYDKKENPVLQDKQRCGANLCFAGHVAASTGGKWLLGPEDLQKMIESGQDPNSWDFALAALKPLPGEISQTLTHPVTGRYRKYVSARERAMTKLGLTDDEAGDLFNGNNSIWALRRNVAKLIEKAYAEQYPYGY